MAEAMEILVSIKAPIPPRNSEAIRISAMFRSWNIMVSILKFSEGAAPVCAISLKR